MASTTTNLGLHLLGASLLDKETYFEAWRQTVNGEMDDSNMNIIDDAYGEMADDIQGIKDDIIPDADIDDLIEELFPPVPVPPEPSDDDPEEEEEEEDVEPEPGE